MTYRIATEVFAATDKMIANGSVGRAVIKIVCDDVTVAELRDIYIRTANDGRLFVTYPSQKDRNGKKNDAGKDLYYPYYKLFPDSKEDYEKLSAKIIEKLNNGQTTVPTTRAPAPSSNKPATSSPPKMSQPKPVATPSVSSTEEFNFS